MNRTIFLYIDINDADFEKQPTQMYFYFHYLAIFRVMYVWKGQFAEVRETLLVDVMLPEFVYEGLSRDIESFE